MSVTPVKVALIGNPNAGKSTLFNALSGLRQHVGNYPGVTVELKSGRYDHGTVRFDLIDLPGTYSLAPRSPDEMVAVDLLLGRNQEQPRPDVIISVVDASNLDRHLYLTTQLLDLGIPVVIALTMVDVAESQGVRVDPGILAKETGLTVVPVRAHKGVGLHDLKVAVQAAVGTPGPEMRPRLPDVVEEEVARLNSALGDDVPHFLATRLLLDVGGSIEEWFVGRHGKPLAQLLDSARTRLATAGNPVPSGEARIRYGWIRSVTSRAVSKPDWRVETWSDRIDKILTHRLWGTLVFLAMMLAVFQAIFVAAEPLMGLIDEGTQWLAGIVNSQLPAGAFRSLLSDGIIAGVGGIVKFLPQILILFGFIAVLEDCGYMTRAAFLMDRLMNKCGLSGKSFIPLMSSVACAVPGIMATRVVENRRDRLATILVAPLMSCSARLPVYTLLIGAFLTEGFPVWLPGLTLFGLYLLGFALAPLVALILKKTLLRGAPPLFVMELPAYRRPSILAVARRMMDAGWAFLRRAGTFILASMVVVWALLYFPHFDAEGRSYEEQITALEERAASHSQSIDSLRKDGQPVPEELEGKDSSAEREINRIRSEWQRNSILGRTGRALEPVFWPLGWDWRIGMATLASFPAREVIVGTLGIIYEVGAVEGEEGEESLRSAIRSDWSKDPIRGRYAVPVALSIMVFFALCCQCASTLVVIRRETGSWIWPVFTFLYMTGLAYAGGALVFQVGRIITDLVV